jgi:nucleoid-associated protein EbfC
MNNNPFKMLGDLNQLRKQAKQMQQQLAAEQIVIEEGDIRVVITGDQKVVELSVQGISSPEVIDILNRAIKKSQELAARKLQEMTGGLGGMLGGGNPPQA